MRKQVLSLCLAAAFSILPAAAQTGPGSGAEALPAGEPHPETVALENAVLDAVCLIESGDYPSARTILDSLDRSCPQDAAVQYYLGLCAYVARDAEASVARFEKAVALDPTNTWYKEALANLCINTGDATRAGELFSELSITNPARFRDAYTLALIADAHRMKRDYDSFFGTLTQLVRSEDADDEIKYRALMGALGGFDSRTFNSILPRIDTLLLRFTEAEPASVPAHELRMETAFNLKHWETVIAEAERLIELQPGDTTAIVSALSVIGDTYHQTGQSRKSYKTYDKALKLKPDYCPVLNNYAYYLSEERRRLCKAEKMSRITVEQEPDNSTYLDTYGWILFLRGKAAKAKPYFKHAMLYGGKDSPVVLMHYSLVLKALGEEELASYYKNLAESKTK